MIHAIDPSGEPWGVVESCMLVRGAPHSGPRVLWWHIAKWLSFADISRTDCRLGTVLNIHESGEEHVEHGDFLIREDRFGKVIHLFGADFDYNRVRWIYAGIRLRSRADIAPIQWPGDPGTGALLFLDPKPCALLMPHAGPWKRRQDLRAPRTIGAAS